jgi:hypothetical protein
MEQASARGWKLYVGVALFVYSILTIGIAALSPLLFPAAIAVIVGAGAILSGEIGFWVSVALLGRPFVAGLKARFTSFFVRKAKGERLKKRSTVSAERRQ